MKRTLLPSNEKFDSTASCHPPSCNFSCHISVGSFSDWKVGRIFRNALFIATILAKMKFFASSFQSKSDGCAAHFWRKTHRSSLFSSRVIFLLSIEKISHLSYVNNDLDSKNHDLLVSFFAQSRCCPISGLCVYAAVQSAVFACTLLSNQRFIYVRDCWLDAKSPEYVLGKPRPQLARHQIRPRCHLFTGIRHLASVKPPRKWYEGRNAGCCMR